MRKVIAGLAPFDFYKLCHHGSWNGFGTEILGDLGDTRYLGICTGEKSPSHPAKKTLDLLRQNSDDLVWARTDRNGRTSFTYGKKARVTPSRGKLKTDVMNKKDEGGPGEALVPLVPAPPVPIAAEPPKEPAVPAATTDDVVEITARVPHTKTRVTITIDVEPAEGTDGRRRAAAAAAEAAPNPPMNVGRSVDGLLFVTSAEGLARNIGPAGAPRSRPPRPRRKGPGHAAGGSHGVVAGRGSRSAGTRAIGCEGAAVIGGYDVVPAQRLDCLPPNIRARMSGSGDPDNFIVWSDDCYGDRDGDRGLPEVPVSRIPDGHSPALVATALSTPPTLSTAARGVRNVARPFAEGHLTPRCRRTQMYSAPVVFSDPRYQLDTD